MDIQDMVSISTESRNVTESDIPGPGRLLGEVYAKLGRKLEIVLNFAARSAGRGPAPTANEIERLARTLRYKKSCHMYNQFPPCPKVVVKKLEKKLEASELGFMDMCDLSFSDSCDGMGLSE